MEQQNIVVIGCGNVASYFAHTFHSIGHCIVQIFHPNIEKAKALADLYQAEPVCDTDKINPHANLYIIAVKDNAIIEVAHKLPNTQGIIVHTSGSVGIDVLNKHHRKAVFYPLQSFTKKIVLSNRNFPILIESYNQNDIEYLTKLGKDLGNEVIFMNSQERSRVHLAAVFAANFTNHCIKMAYDIMIKNNHQPEMLLPLIKEIINKLNYISPQQAQTGPAVRNDYAVIEKHLQMLKGDQEIQHIYQVLTQHIQQTS